RRRDGLTDQPSGAQRCGDVGIGGRRAEYLVQATHHGLGDALGVRSRELAGSRDDTRFGLALRWRRRPDVAAAAMRLPERLGGLEVRLDQRGLLSREPV